MDRQRRTPAFYALAAVFTLFVLFLYGPMITIFVLSFQGPEGGLTFPMRGVSLHWFAKLWEGMGVVDIAAAFRARTKKVAWKASSASWWCPATRRQTPQTIGPCRRTRAAKAASSRCSTNEPRRSPSSASGQARPRNSWTARASR